MRLLPCWGLLSLLAFIPQSTLASVLAIDYGTEFMKASLMKPGVPFDVLLNKDSRRKIQSTVAWKKTDRLFGQDALNLASRFPSDSFSSVKYLQAAPFDSEAVSYYTKISTANIIPTHRGTVALKQSDGTEWSTEELIAMQFAYVKQLAEAVGNEKVRDVIVTVPPYYSQFERDAVVDAIEISGLRTLALINDGTAVAVNYAMTRSFPTPEYHIIYDAGASSIRATVTGVAGTSIAVAGVGYDRTVGGTELDRRLREIFIEKFNGKYKKNLREDKKGMAKLWKETNRVKGILSANTEATAIVESLAWDIDFRETINRGIFEAACEDLKPIFAQPIHDALHNAGLTIDEIKSVILTGGSSRTPMIRASVKAAVGGNKIALNVNGDEAAVLGAALHGAGLSRQFKTKNIKVSDISVHDIQASYLAASTTSTSRPRTITSLVFPAGSKVGTKKILTFKRKEDFIISLDYKTAVAPGFPTRMLEAEIMGVEEAIGNLTERGAVDPVVKATLTLSESGFVSISDAIAFGEIKDESIAGKLKGFFGGSSESPDTATESAEHAPPRDTETTSAASPSPSDADKKPALVENTISLNVSTGFTTIAPMTVAEKRAARSRLRALDADEVAKNRKEEARNTFETYLYKLRDLLDDENKQTPFKKCSQQSERQSIADKLDELFAWLHDRGDLAETSQFLEKRMSLETLEWPIIHRYTEIEAFPQALNNSQMWNWSTRLFLTEARQNLTKEAAEDLPSKWTKEELDGLEKTLREHESWLSEWVEKQKSVKPHEDPVIETTEMKARAKVLETHLHKLWKRKVPKRKPKPTTTTAEAKATEAAEEVVEDGQVEDEYRQIPLEEQGHDEL
ncbi:uncharacterized protein LACBIDRAFT_189980 [Laccaria bicolor S238N-H82]|uniref:Predicted protein n=1 Tax=Laccaria bicolor (strain S238N-H82 / ATCC MYA-4686) TaxID=486041 RepID=B0D7E0_LACBS|nr:uncharacterized protein LACBIDRAFT_189980 [Laccaria bicolor S238N-H82]EDR09636.1 predicted protein [Laccaria bicolor S238N-H82]|eukprot:XP_001879985.1 predicted protein [Laccaria bicolor S238N-H82]